MPTIFGGLNPICAGSTTLGVGRPSWPPAASPGVLSSTARLASLACSFFAGYQYEDIGVITATAFRGRGLSTACTTALCHDILERGRFPSWSTTPGNVGSRRVAEKLGFIHQRNDYLYVIPTADAVPPDDGPPEPDGRGLIIVVEMYVKAGREEAFQQFEQKAAAIMRDYGGRIDKAIRPEPAGGIDDVPYEVHLVSFPSDDQFANYRRDRRTQELAFERDNCVRHTRLILGRDLGQPY